MRGRAGRGILMNAMTPRQQLTGFLARYTPDVAALAHAVLRGMRVRLPGAVELVYDNYNALVVGFGPNERASEAIFSIAVYPRWVSLCFLQGAQLADPHKLLKGGGTKVRHIVLETAARLDDPVLQDLMARAVACAAKPLDPAGRGRIVIKSVSVKQRPRRPKDA